MTQIVFDLVSVTGDSSRLDSVTVRAPRVRAAVKSPGVVTTRKVSIDAPGGVERVEVEPGPIEVTVKSGLQREVLRLNVPDQPLVFLSDLLGRDEPIPQTEVDRIWETLRNVEINGQPGPPGPPGPPGKGLDWEWEGDGPPPDVIPGAELGDRYLDRINAVIYTLS